MPITKGEALLKEHNVAHEKFKGKNTTDYFILSTEDISKISALVELVEK